jgi:hypothetical protein
VEAEEQPGTSEAQEEAGLVPNGGAVEAEAGSAQPEAIRHRKPKAAARSAQEGASNGAVVKRRKGEKGRLSLLVVREVLTCLQHCPVKMTSVPV